MAVLLETLTILRKRLICGIKQDGKMNLVNLRTSVYLDLSSVFDISTHVIEILLPASNYNTVGIFCTCYIHPLPGTVILATR